jgi:hypothetical protein
MTNKMTPEDTQSVPTNDAPTLSPAEELDFRALFIGDQSENGDVFKELLGQLVEDHLGWRKNYMPGDRAGITLHDKSAPGYHATQARMGEVMNDLSKRMRAGSVPWNSAGRYWGHMNAETLMPSILAYTFAMMWNPNNVALESSMATSQMEAEVGEDFAKLFGFADGWGHLCSDGSLANLEGLWYARCMKSIPLALAEVLPDRVKGKSDWQLLNMSVDETLDILDELESDDYDLVKAASSRSGRNLDRLGKWIVPETKHYSWVKALDISGVGLDQIVAVPVQENYRLDVDALERTINQLAEGGTPILGVVVAGTTEARRRERSTRSTAWSHSGSGCRPREPTSTSTAMRPTAATPARSSSTPTVGSSTTTNWGSCTHGTTSSPTRRPSRNRCTRGSRRSARSSRSPSTPTRWVTCRMRPAASPSGASR